MRLYNVKEVTPTDIGVYIFTFLNFMSCLAFDFYINDFYALKIWLISFSVPFPFIYFVNIKNQRSYDIKVTLDVLCIFVSMVFIAVSIMGYPDFKNEIEKKSKIQEVSEPPRHPVNGEFEKYDFEPVE